MRSSQIGKCGTALLLSFLFLASGSVFLSGCEIGPGVEYEVDDDDDGHSVKRKKSHTSHTKKPQHSNTQKKSGKRK